MRRKPNARMPQTEHSDAAIASPALADKPKCPCCGKHATLGPFDVCVPCAAALGWDPECVACREEGEGREASVAHVDTCAGTGSEQPAATRHADGWGTDDIVAVADVIRAYLHTKAPEVDRLMFNAEVEDIAMRVWPVIEAKVRERVAGQPFAHAVPVRRSPVPEAEAMTNETRTVVLDTDGADWLAEHPERFAAVTEAVQQGRLHLLSTHITEDEIEALDARILRYQAKAAKARLLKQILQLSTPTPTGAFILGKSQLRQARLGGDREVLDVLRSHDPDADPDAVKRRDHMNDALIAITAQHEGVALVTKDGRLSKQAAKVGIEVLTPQQLLLEIGDTGPEEDG